MCPSADSQFCPPVSVEYLDNFATCNSARYAFLQVLVMRGTCVAVNEEDLVGSGKSIFLLQHWENTRSQDNVVIHRA